MDFSNSVDTPQTTVVNVPHKLELSSDTQGVFIYRHLLRKSILFSNKMSVWDKLGNLFSCSMSPSGILMNN